MIAVLEREGCGLVHEVRGDGPALVFTHGAGADRGMFDDQARFFVERGFRVITWDQRMQGQSRPSREPLTPALAVEDLLALIEHLSLDRPTLIGQSLGGNVSQAVVRRRPDLARALVVLGSAWNTAPLSWIDRALLRIAAPTLGLVPEGRLPRMMAGASATTPRGRAYAEGAFARISRSDFVQVWRTTVQLLEPAPDYRTPVPLCLIRGALDRTGNIATAMPRWAAAEGVAEHVIPGAGHLCNVDDPDAVNAVIHAFLVGLSPVR